MKSSTRTKERIRYTRLSPTLYESGVSFPHPTNGAEYKVRIDVGKMEMLIIEIGCGLVSVKKPFKSVRSAKAAARNWIEALGIITSIGKRRR